MFWSADLEIAGKLLFFGKFIRSNFCLEHLEQLKTFDLRETQCN